MLEIKNLCRTYKTKKGVEVKALDDINLKIPNKGMVFILGKSGSGKSTLLNVLGGLDKYDSGEIIIKGKSSKDFSQSDFDSYRNTYLGFIFQEYNILDEFSVGANIALAIELQGRKPTNDEVNSIMDDVDLKGYGNRKPNELSGGQKQRVAIARALVKNPEIIMADEPTGALDSKTGQQVFDTLKHLSKEKLVIVVSHDREFAEIYGDRVIELADGKIISDIEKHHVPGETKSEGIKVVDDKIIQIKAGYKLSNEELALIGKYIANANSTTYISIDDRTNEALKKTARIDEAGNYESFKNTNQDNIIVDSDDSKFKLIKSKLSRRHSLRIGASGLKVKPFRLIITIILSFVAFGLFGIADTMGSYNKIDSTVQSIMDSDVKNVSFSKEESFKKDGDTYIFNRKISNNDLSMLKEKTGVNYYGIFDEINNSISSFYEDPTLINSKNYAFYHGTIQGYIEMTKAECESLGFTLLGDMPQNDYEIVITDYIYDHFATAGFKYLSTDIKADEMTKKELIDKKIVFSDTEFTIVGILDTNLNEERYEKFKNVTTEHSVSIADYILQQEFASVVNFGFHSLCFTNPGAMRKILRKGVNAFDYGYINFSSLNGELDHRSLANVSKMSEYDKLYFFNSEKTSLGDNEILISVDMLRYALETKNYADGVTKTVGEAFNEYIDNRIINYAHDKYDPSSFSSEDEYRSYLWSSVYDNTSPDHYTMKREYRQMTCDFFEDYSDEIFSMYPSGISLTGEYFINRTNNLENFDYKIVGFVDSNDTCVFDDAFYEKYTGENGGKYAFAIGKMPSSRSEIKRVVEFYYDSCDEKNIHYLLNNEVQEIMNQVNNFIEQFAVIFMYIGIGFAVFASLMLFNFISISISYKKREIGILRAVGARSKDVFRIFFNESLIISLINFVLASVGATVIIIFINNVLRNEYGLLITFLNIGIRQYALMFAISFVVAFVSSFFPVYRIAKKRPIDAIKNK